MVAGAVGVEVGLATSGPMGAERVVVVSAGAVASVVQ